MKKLVNMPLVNPKEEVAIWTSSEKGFWSEGLITELSIHKDLKKIAFVKAFIKCSCKEGIKHAEWCF